MTDGGGSSSRRKNPRQGRGKSWVSCDRSRGDADCRRKVAEAEAVAAEAALERQLGFMESQLERRGVRQVADLPQEVGKLRHGKRLGE